MRKFVEGAKHVTVVAVIFALVVLVLGLVAIIRCPAADIPLDNDPTPAAPCATLSRLERDHPGWHTWTGVGGLLYARRLMSSPPIVYRAIDPDELEARIREHEGRQR